VNFSIKSGFQRIRIPLKRHETASLIPRVFLIVFVTRSMLFRRCFASRRIVITVRTRVAVDARVIAAVYERDTGRDREIGRDPYPRQRVHAPFGPPHTVARPLRPFETRKHNFYAMFGLLLRADQGTAKRAIIFGGYDRGSRRRERGPPGGREGRDEGFEKKARRGRMGGKLCRLRQKYFGRSAGMENHTTPLALSSLPSLASLRRRARARAHVGVCACAHQRERTRTVATRGGCRRRGRSCDVNNGIPGVGVTLRYFDNIREGCRMRSTTNGDCVL